ncbi:340cb978-78a1-406e-a15b-6d92b08687df [Sclerotinia trifoliorum]|uniref:340cb978-78a1-406e-a15b-6d92b08687df n=1 Tax=Sclerotinia trifoliorum TaxID=28548 RepID=A0A8H2ZTQ6_9HELO|nr:340cb978-78a1-406e-a15b-6d92b08687df [Sclerotinia trifoliorum]
MSQSPTATTSALSRWPKTHSDPKPNFKTPFVDDRTISAAGKFDEKRELGQCNALYSLLEDRYRGKYPLTSKTLKPTSNPTYYEDLVRELEEAPKRSWFQQQVNKWKGALRFQ